MKKIAYVNCMTGVAGDMIIASCLDAGVTTAALERGIKRGLGIQDWRFKVQSIPCGHTTAKSLTVEGDRPFGAPSRMLACLRKSRFSPKVKAKSVSILESIIAAESKVHGVPQEKVHFHELNSIDTLVDITGACLALEMLAVDEVYASAVNLGAGAPATIEIARANKLAVFSDEDRFELATPTGTALIAGLAEQSGEMPLMTIENTGSGTGTRKIPGKQSVVKLLVGTAEGGTAAQGLADETVLLETNIDDMDPRIYPYVTEKLFAAGVRDVWLTQVLMKKGRPGIVVSVLCDAPHEEAAVQILFRETTTLGIRRFVCRRHLLDRRVRQGKKYARLAGKAAKVAVEFEVAKQRALKTGTPLKDLL